MLSTAKIGAASWRYYQRTVGGGACEYYLGVGEAPVRWYGRGLDELGLAPGALVQERQLEALFARAMNPLASPSGQRRRIRPGRRPDGLRRSTWKTSASRSSEAAKSTSV
jgi:hypothetical protein